MRIAFEVFGGSSWTGGINYLTNLLSAIDELPGKPLQPVLFASPQTDSKTLERLRPYLSCEPILSSLWTKGTVANRVRFVSTFLTGKDRFAEYHFKRAKIDLVFVHASWFGSKFPFPTLVWIGDFQHRALPQMFSKAANRKREYGFRLLTEYGTTIVASSNTGCDECLDYYPAAKGKLAALPFVIKVPTAANLISCNEIKDKYGLPEKFFYLPNQFWRHKNHRILFEAAIEARKRCSDLTIVCSGAPSDPRDPSYFPELSAWVKAHDLDNSIKILGMIPYEDIFALMRSSLAMINPSLYEGWSTTVEEAKALGVPMLLSDIPVHREQAPGIAQFFDPKDAGSIARSLCDVWGELSNKPDSYREELLKVAKADLLTRRAEFAQTFARIAKETVRTFSKTEGNRG